MRNEKRQNILLVDDDRFVLNALGDVLEENGYIVSSEVCPRDALARLRFDRFDAIISDNNMPTMSGPEFLAMVADRHPDPLRIMLTSSTDMKTAIDCVNYGRVHRLLSKPWDALELAVILHSAFEQLENERETRRLALAAQRKRTSAVPLEQESPGISRVVRDGDGAIVLNQLMTGS